MKKSYKKCEFCGQRVKSKYKHYEENHDCATKAESQLKADELKLENWSGETKIECAICGYKAKELTRHLKTAHNMTVNEYELKFGDIISEYEKLKKSIFWRKKNSGKNNPMYGRSPWNTDNSRALEVKEKLGASWRGKSFSQGHKSKLASAKIGITGESANAYGPHNIPEESRQRMREGNEKALLEFRKNRASKFENELAIYLQQLFPGLKRQEKFGFNLVDFYIPEKQLIVEADGIYWHGIIHEAIDKESATDQQRHTYKYDKIKTTYLKNRGYTLIRIREDHYNEHKKKGDVLKWLKKLLA